MNLARLPATATVADTVEAIGRDGYAIVERRCPEQLMDRIADELAPYVEATPFGDDASTGFGTKRTGSLIARSPSARSLVMDEIVLGTVGELLDHVPSFHVSLTETVYLYPGSAAQFIHRDELAYDGYPFATDYEVQISTLWALSDYEEEMGATRVVPRSHILDSAQRFTYEDTFPAEMPKGSVIIYSGKLFHGSGENRSERTRKAINVNYAVGWLRQEENQYLSCPVEVARTLPEELLRLMGYQTSSALGHVGDRLDPLGVVVDRYRDVRATNPRRREWLARHGSPPGDQTD